MVATEPTVQRVTPRPPGRGKRIVQALFGIAALPFVAGYRITAALLPDRRDEVFQGYSQFVGLWPGMTGNFFRLAFYRQTLDSCSADAFIGFGTLFATPEVSIGRNVYIGPRCMIAHADIRDDVLIGSNVDVLAGKHQHHFARIDVPIRLQGGRYERVSIGPDAWLGNGAVVAANVGAHAIVAAGAVVVKPVEDLAIAGGNPATVIARRS